MFLCMRVCFLCAYDYFSFTPSMYLCMSPSELMILVYMKNVCKIHIRYSIYIYIYICVKDNSK